VAPDEPLPVAARRMVENDISHCPVTDADGNGLGILTTTDLAESLSATDAPIQSG
jgi:CBS domain-containing protein